MVVGLIAFVVVVVSLTLMALFMSERLRRSQRHRERRRLTELQAMTEMRDATGETPLEALQRLSAWLDRETTELDNTKDE